MKEKADLNRSYLSDISEAESTSSNRITSDNFYNRYKNLLYNADTVDTHLDIYASLKLEHSDKNLKQISLLEREIS